MEATENGTTPRILSGPPMKVPRSTVVEFVETVCGFENEFRSRFNRLEDAVVNLKTRVSRLKKVAAKTGSSSCLNNTIQQTGSAASTSTDALGDGQSEFVILCFCFCIFLAPFFSCLP